MYVLTQILHYALLALGFGFVVFFHELGHFLSAKFCDVKVEQFAVGFGPAIFAWRKGIGFRLGGTHDEYSKLIDEHLAQKNQTNPNAAQNDPNLSRKDQAARDLGLGDTEYRLNWVPLGGYVKMLGQDDLKPGVTADDPRAYNAKSVRSRMMIVSAGVIMNVILAAIGFMILFLIGFDVPPAVVGSILSDSPALHARTDQGGPAALQVGDQILKIDGSTTGDFTKIAVAVALSHEGDTMAILVRHPDGSTQTLHVTPAHPESEMRAFLALGIGTPMSLKGIDKKAVDEMDMGNLSDQFTKSSLAIQPGDTVVAINDTPLANPNDNAKDAKDLATLAAALQASDGRPVNLTVKTADGKTEVRQTLPDFEQAFGRDDVNFGGMEPRVQVIRVIKDSPAQKKLVKPGDIVLAIDVATDRRSNPSRLYLMEHLNAAGQNDQTVTLTVMHPGETKPTPLEDMSANSKVGEGRRGLGIGLGVDTENLVVAEVLPGSAADTAGIPRGAEILTIDDVAVHNWFEVRRIFAAASPDKPLTLSLIKPNPDRTHAQYKIQLDAEQIATAARIQPTTNLYFAREALETLKTRNPVIAAQWGMEETRDFILQAYLTLRRMIQGDVPLKGVVGPVGIFAAGGQFAGKGLTWLLWFLCMISANLAVVNFLPLPVVDGGLFTFLILEKIQGKPLPPNAQRIIQYVGLALILCVVIVLTYQDIARLVG